MNIAIIGSTKFDSLEFHIKDSMTTLGHTCEIFDYPGILNDIIKSRYEYWFRRFADGYSLQKTKQLFKRVVDFNPDLIICTYRDVHPYFVLSAKERIGVPVVHLNPDAITTFDKQQVFASEYDFLFSKDRYIVSYMRDKLDLNAIYLPECFNQRFCKSIYENKLEAERVTGIDVLAFGSFYPTRVRMINKLIGKGINVSLHGYKGPYIPSDFSTLLGPAIYGSEKTDLIFGSKIVFNNFHYAEIDSANEKFFVINGVGGFQICDFKPSVKEYSIVDTDRFTFRTINEAIDRIRYYLTNSDERHEIARLQKDHFLKYHTYDVRMQCLLDIVFGCISESRPF